MFGLSLTGGGGVSLHRLDAIQRFIIQDICLRVIECGGVGWRQVIGDCVRVRLGALRN